MRTSNINLLHRAETATNDDDDNERTTAERQILHKREYDRVKIRTGRSRECGTHCRNVIVKCNDGDRICRHVWYATGGGRRFPGMDQIAQATITDQFILKDARREAYATIALMFLTYFVLQSTRARYDAASSFLSLEVATVMDISLGHDEELKYNVDKHVL